MPSLQFMVTVELRKESGKFAPREELVDAVREQIEQAAGEGVDGVGADGESVYVVDDLLVEEYEAPRPNSRRVTDG